MTYPETRLPIGSDWFGLVRIGSAASSNEPALGLLIDIGKGCSAASKPDFSLAATTQENFTEIRSMEKILPVLQIDDYDQAVDFYRDRLGFEILMEHRHEPGFPVFMIVEKGPLEIALSEHGRGHSGTEIYIYVKDLATWHRRCSINNIPLEHPPQKMPWGSTEMLVKDPFRNALRFSQVGTHEGTNTPNKT